MRHLVDGRKFGINTSHRKAMFKALANSLILHEQITTTVAKAKELRRVVDRLITLGKRGGLGSRRLAFARTRDRDSVAKLFSALAERYSKRNGGYTRVLRLDGTRWGDATEMAVVELVDRPIIDRKKKAKATDRKTKDAHDHDQDAEKSAAPKKAAKDRTAKAKVGASAVKPKSKATTVRKTSARSSGSSS
ncbi:MAG: 50S ribosomal protein L17 [Deltaproteobacteria bacterium]|nr:50S ribosomal protein L17 [Deltaproteobacteria bacterium]